MPPLIIRPQLQCVFLMLAWVGGLVAMALALPVLIAALAPEHFPFVRQVGFWPVLMGLIIPVPLLPTFVLLYLLERRKHCVISASGLEVWKRGRKLQSLAWDEVAGVRLALYSMTILPANGAPAQQFTFVKRSDIAGHVPASKRIIDSRL